MRSDTGEIKKPNQKQNKKKISDIYIYKKNWTIKYYIEFNVGIVQTQYDT